MRKIKRISGKKLLSTGLALVMAVSTFSGIAPKTVQAAETSNHYERLTITSGLNADVVATSTLTGSSESRNETSSVDNAGKLKDERSSSCFYTVGLNEISGYEDGYLPDGRIIESENSKTLGLTWQLAEYDQENALKLIPNQTSESLTFSAEQSYARVYFLATAGGFTNPGEPAIMKVSVTYTDNSTDSEKEFKVGDWFNETADKIATDNYKRCDLDGSADKGTDHGAPYLSQCVMDVDSSKVIQSIKITNQSSDVYLCVFAVTGEKADIPAPEVTTPIDANATDSFTAIWNKVVDDDYDVIGYAIDIATDDNFNEILAEYDNKILTNEDLIPDNNTVSFVVNDINPGTPYYYRVRTVGERAEEVVGQSASSEIVSVNPKKLSVTISEIGTGYTVSVPEINNVSYDGSYEFIVEPKEGTTLDGLGIGTTSGTVTKVKDGDSLKITISNITDDCEISLSKLDTPKVEDKVAEGADTFDAEWTAVEGAEKYVVTVAKDENFVEIIENDEVSDTKLENISIAPNTKYYYSVKAVNAITESSVAVAVVNPKTFEVTGVESTTEYTVSVPEINSVPYKGDYEFKIDPMDGYTLKDVSVDVTSGTITQTKDGDSFKITISNITNDCEVSISAVEVGPKKYVVEGPKEGYSYNILEKSDSSVISGGSYQFKVTAADGYTLADIDTRVLVNGVPAETMSVEPMENENAVIVTIENITSDIEVQVLEESFDKEAVKILIGNKADELKKIIKGNENLSEEEKTQLPAQIDEIVNTGIANIDAPATDTLQELADAKNDTLGKLDDILKDIVEKDALAAKDAIDEAAANAKDSIDAMNDLDATAKQKYKDLVDDEVEAGKGSIDTAQTCKEVEQAKEETIEAIEEIVQGIEKLPETKSEADEKIDEKADEAKKEIDKLADLKDDEKKPLKDEIDTLVTEGKESVDSAKTPNQVEEEKGKVLDSISGVVDKAKEQDLASTKNAAKKDLEDAGASLIAKIDGFKTVTPSQKKVWENQILAKVEDGTNKISAAETKPGVEDAKSNAVNAMHQILVGIIDQLLPSLNDIKYDINIKNTLDDLKGIIDDLSEEQKKQLAEAEQKYNNLASANDPEKAAMEEFMKNSMSVEESDAILNKTNTDKVDPKDSLFGRLRLKAHGKKNAIKLTWTKVTSSDGKYADGYRIYGAKCGSKIKYIKSVDGSKNTLTFKKLKKKTYYKYIVKAYKIVDGKQRVFAVSKSAHATTKGGKHGNPTKVVYKKSTITLKKKQKKTFKPVMKYDKKVRIHIAKFRYETTNKNVVKVDKKGKMKAVKKGTAYVYIYAQNGFYKKVKVKVK